MWVTLTKPDVQERHYSSVQSKVGIFSHQKSSSFSPNDPHQHQLAQKTKPFFPFLLTAPIRTCNTSKAFRGKNHIIPITKHPKNQIRYISSHLTKSFSHATPVDMNMVNDKNLDTTQRSQSMRERERTMERALTPKYLLHL